MNVASAWVDRNTTMTMTTSESTLDEATTIITPLLPLERVLSVREEEDQEEEKKTEHRTPPLDVDSALKSSRRARELLESLQERRNYTHVSHKKKTSLSSASNSTANKNSRHPHRPVVLPTHPLTTIPSSLSKSNSIPQRKRMQGWSSTSSLSPSKQWSGGNNGGDAGSIGTQTTVEDSFHLHSPVSSLSSASSHSSGTTSATNTPRGGGLGSSSQQQQQQHQSHILPVVTPEPTKPTTTTMTHTNPKTQQHDVASSALLSVPTMTGIQTSILIQHSTKVNKKHDPTSTSSAGNKPSNLQNAKQEDATEEEEEEEERTLLRLNHIIPVKNGKDDNHDNDRPDKTEDPPTPRNQSADPTASSSSSSSRVSNTRRLSYLIRRKNKSFDDANDNNNNNKRSSFHSTLSLAPTNSNHSSTGTTNTGIMPRRMRQRSTSRNSLRSIQSFDDHVTLLKTLKREKETFAKNQTSYKKPSVTTTCLTVDTEGFLLSSTSQQQQQLQSPLAPIQSNGIRLHKSFDDHVPPSKMNLRGHRRRRPPRTNLRPGIAANGTMIRNTVSFDDAEYVPRDIATSAVSPMNLPLKPTGITTNTGIIGTDELELPPQLVHRRSDSHVQNDENHNHGATFASVKLDSPESRKTYIESLYSGPRRNKVAPSQHRKLHYYDSTMGSPRPKGVRINKTLVRGRVAVIDKERVFLTKENGSESAIPNDGSGNESVSAGELGNRPFQEVLDSACVSNRDQRRQLLQLLQQDMEKPPTGRDSQSHPPCLTSNEDDSSTSSSCSINLSDSSSDDDFTTSTETVSGMISLNYLGLKQVDDIPETSISCASSDLTMPLPASIVQDSHTEQIASTYSEASTMLPMSPNAKIVQEIDCCCNNSVVSMLSEVKGLTPDDNEEDEQLTIATHEELSAVTSLLKRDIVKKSKKSRNEKLLFVTGRAADKLCGASGGHWDLAQRSGYHSPSKKRVRFLSVKVSPVEAPPTRLVLLSTDMRCGAQGSLYDIAVRSGCDITLPFVFKRRRQRLSPRKRNLQHRSKYQDKNENCIKSSSGSCREHKTRLLPVHGGHYDIALHSGLTKEALRSCESFSVTTLRHPSEMKRRNNGRVLSELESDRVCGANGTLSLLHQVSVPVTSPIIPKYLNRRDRSLYDIDENDHDDDVVFEVQ